MTVSIPVLTLMVIIAYVVVGLGMAGLKVWHAIVCPILGFLLASTGSGPQITSVLSGIVHQARLSGGKADR